MEIFQLEGLAEIQTILTRKTHFHDWKDFFLSPFTLKRGNVDREARVSNFIEATQCLKNVYFYFVATIMIDRYRG